ncbi:MAG: hypothetical protein WCP57_07875 [Bacteroidota bacterium]
MKNVVSILMLFFLFGNAMAQDDMNSGVVYGENYAFLLVAPNGWVLDNSSGESQGLHAVFYKKGESWEKAETVMYAAGNPIKNKKYKTFDDFVSSDVNQFKNDYKDLILIAAPSILISDSTKAIVKYFSGNTYANFDAIAYIDAGKTAVVIAMSSRTKEGFEQSKEAFQKLVESYVFITAKFNIKKISK